MTSQDVGLLNHSEVKSASGSTARKVSSAQKVSQSLASEGADLLNQEFARLVQTVYLSRKTGAPRQVIVCGVDRVSPSADICVGLARALAAHTGKRVCLVDMTSELSASDAELRPASPAVALESWTCVGDSFCLTVLDSAEQNSNQLLALREAFDYVLINAPSPNGSGVASMLGESCDGAILVVQASTTRKAAAEKAKTSLLAVNVPLLGTVLANRSFPVPERLYRRL